MINLKKEQVEQIINYLNIAFEKAINDQLPMSQDSIKNMIKLLNKKLKKKWVFHLNKPSGKILKSKKQK